MEHGGHGIPDTEAFNRFAIYKKGELYTITNEVPDWYKRYIDQYILAIKRSDAQESLRFDIKLL